jgi:hypothetical protein
MGPPPSKEKERPVAKRRIIPRKEWGAAPPTRAKQSYCFSSKAANSDSPAASRARGWQNVDGGISFANAARYCVGDGRR